MGNLPIPIKKAFINQQKPMIVNSLLIARTNGVSICQYHRDTPQVVSSIYSKSQKQKTQDVSKKCVKNKNQQRRSNIQFSKKFILQLFQTNMSSQSDPQNQNLSGIQLIKAQVIQHSRKLTINTYDNQVLNLQVKNSVVYYRAYASLLFIIITTMQYPMNLILNLFEKIKQIYQEQVRSIFYPQLDLNTYVNLTIPAKLTLSEEYHLKCMSIKLASMFRQNQQKTTQKFSAINNNLQKYLVEIISNQRELKEKQQKMKQYEKINKYNQQAKQYQSQINSLMLIMYARKSLVFLAYGLTLIIWIYFLLN